MGPPRLPSGKESTCQAEDMQEAQVQSLGWEDPPKKKKKWQPTPVFLPGKSQGQRSLVGYSPWGHRRVDSVTKITIMEYNLQKNTDHYVVLETNIKL